MSQCRADIQIKQWVILHTQVRRWLLNLSDLQEAPTRLSSSSLHLPLEGATFPDPEGASGLLTDGYNAPLSPCSRPHPGSDYLLISTSCMGVMSPSPSGLVESGVLTQYF